MSRPVLIVRIEGVPVETFLKRMFHLAYRRSKVYGMGVLQERPDASEEDIWNNIVNHGSSIGKAIHPGRILSADHVFGRRVMLSVKILENNSFEIDKSGWHRDHQSFCGSYHTVYDLIGCTLDHVGGRIWAFFT